MVKKSLIGLCAGIICGLFSTGGGMILVPSFIYLLKEQSIVARSTSVFCILMMVITSSFFYYKGNFFDWKTGALCATGGIFGGYIGAKLLGKVSEYKLKLIFTFFLIYIAIRFLQ